MRHLNLWPAIKGENSTLVAPKWFHLRFHFSGGGKPGHSLKYLNYKCVFQGLYVCGSCHWRKSVFDDLFQHVTYQHQGSRPGGLVTLNVPWISQFPQREFVQELWHRNDHIQIFFKYLQTSLRLKSRCFQINKNSQQSTPQTHYP